MAKFQVTVNKKKCIGCGACTVQCDNFELVGDKAQEKKSVVDELGCNKDAQEICPVQAISVKEVK